MSDRLTELKHQRALVAEHLQWLDREIARADPIAVVPAPPHPATVASPAAAGPAADLTSSSSDPALLVLQDEERRRGEVSKSGCWIVFSALLVLVVGSITAFILIKYR